MSKNPLCSRILGGRSLTDKILPIINVQCPHLAAFLGCYEIMVEKSQTSQTVFNPTLGAMPSLELQQKLVGLQMVKILTLFSYSTIVTDEETETNDITNRV